MARRPRLVTNAPSKNGCATCRIRKVKCDEGVPHCQRCVTTGRKCDGYVTRGSSVTTSREETRVRIMRPTHNLNQLSKDFDRSGFETKSFQFFIVETAIPLWAISPSKGWIQVVLQRAMRNKAIFQAVAAVGSVHAAMSQSFNDRFCGAIGPTGQEDALSQYVKATVSLNHYVRDTTSLRAPSTENLTIIFAACILFVCFEVFQDRSSFALTHLRAAKQILCKGFLDHHKRMQTEENDLVDLIDALDSIASDSVLISRIQPTGAEHSMFTLHSRPIERYSTEEDTKFLLEELLQATSQWQESITRVARSHLVYMNSTCKNTMILDAAAHCYSKQMSCNDATLRRWEYLIDAHARWLELCSDWLSCSNENTSAAAVRLLLQHSVSVHLLKTARQPMESVWSAHDEELENLLDLSERYMALVADSAACKRTSQYLFKPYAMDAEPQEGFSLELGLLPALFTCALHSHRVKTRQKAISLLRQVRWREARYWSPALAWYAQIFEDLRNGSEQAARRGPIDYVFEPLPGQMTRFMRAYKKGGEDAVVQVETYLSADFASRVTQEEMVSFRLGQ